MKKRIISMLLILCVIMCGLPSLAFADAAAGNTFNVTVSAAEGGKVSTDGVNWSDSVTVPVVSGETLGDSVKYKADEGYKLDGVSTQTVIKKIFASSSNTAVIDASGNLYTAGDNTRGQLGRQVSSYKGYDSVLTKVDLSVKITDAALGMDHIVVLDENGDVWTAGSNQYGALGTNENVGKSYGQNSTLKKVTVGDGSFKIKAVAAGLYSTVLIDENGGVWTAGQNRYGELGRSDNVGSTKYNSELKKADGLENVKIIKAAAGTYHTVLLDEEGNVWTAGTSLYGTLGRETSAAGGNYANPTFEKVTDGISGVKITDIAAGGYHSVLLDENGNVWTAGSNLNGELGRAMTGSANNEFMKADLQGAAAAKSIAASNGNTIVIDTDGNARTCGIKGFGQLGRDTANTNNPELLAVTEGVGSTKMIAAAAGNVHSILLDENGGIWSCGNNTSGQLCRDESLRKSETFAAVTDGLTQKITFDDMKNTVITSDRVFKVLSAVREKIQIEYILDGGEWTDGFTPKSFIYKGEGLLLPDASKLKKTGYTFNQWDVPSPGANPLKCYAKWTVNQYTITFDTDGGSAVSPIKQDYNSSVTAPSDPTKTGYTFKGWNISVPDRMPAENITIKALWADETQPEVCDIKFGNVSVKTPLESVSFESFLSENINVTISAEDKGSGVKTIEYIKSDKVLTEQQARALGSDKWTKGTSFVITASDKAKVIVYVRVTDNAGNAAIFASKGAVFDLSNPIIEGIENNKIYCEDKTVTVTDDNLKSVTVDGTEVTLDNNKSFKLTAKNTPQEIIAEDKAGNKTVISVTVNDGHTYEWKSENGKYWKKCKFCSDETQKKDIPDIKLNAPDKVCRTHKYKFNFTLPEGCVFVEGGYELHYMGDNIFPEIKGDVYNFTVTGNFTDEDSSVKVSFIIRTSDGFEFTTEKTAEILSDHIGGKATCTEKKVCEVCSDSYGEKDPANHSALKHISKVEATENSEGNIEYWYCEGCGKYYKDAAATKEITKAETVIEKEKSPKTGEKAVFSVLAAMAVLIAGASVSAAAAKRKKK